MVGTVLSFEKNKTSSLKKSNWFYLKKNYPGVLKIHEPIRLIQFYSAGSPRGSGSARHRVVRRGVTSGKKPGEYGTQVQYSTGNLSSLKSTDTVY